MKRRAKKKIREREILRQLDRMINRTCGEVTGSCKRLQGLVADMRSSLSVFPLAVKDWATDPPIHQGEYIVWFVRRGKPVQTRKYLYVDKGWLDSRGGRVDMNRLRPAMWMMVPVIDPGVIEVYARREE